MTRGRPESGGAELCYQSGVAQQAEGDLAHARASYERAIALDPRHAKAHNNLGSVLHLQGDRSAAILCYGRALASCPDLLDAHRNLAIAHLEAADWGRAQHHARRAVELEPTSAEASVLLGEILRGAGRFEEALAACRAAVGLDTRSARAWNGMGLALKGLGLGSEARAAFSAATSLDDGFAEAHVNLGLVLQEEGDSEAALACYRRALDRDPRLAEAHVCIGSLLEAASDSPEAMDHYRSAIALQPGLAQARFNHALQLLHREEYERGWEEYEWRRRLPEVTRLLPEISAPEWDGSPLAGKTILLHTEQGFGDAIQFLRYAPLLAAAGARVVVLCPEALVRVARSVAGVAVALSAPEALPPCDVSCPLLSLPRLLYRSHPGIPAGVPYVLPDAASTARFRNLIGSEASSLSVGLVWASHSARRELGALKSLELRALAPLAAAGRGARFFSLQTGPSAAQVRNAPAGMVVLDLGSELRDFSETAAAIANLDLVITVDTAVAHLAGAMAKPVWTLVPFPPDWRWRRSGERSVWYPTMRLFRQGRSREWGSVVEEVGEALRVLRTGFRLES